MDPQSPQHTHNSVEASSQSQARDVGDGVTLVDHVIPGTETPSITGELSTPTGHVRKTSVRSARGLNFPIVDIHK